MTYFHTWLLCLLCHSIKKTVFWLKICIWLKDTQHISCWKNFQVRFGISETLEAARNNTGLINKLPGSGRTWTVHTDRECDLVGDFMSSQEGAPQTHHSVLEISRNIGICWSLDTSSIPFSDPPTHAEENNVPNQLLMNSRVVLHHKWGGKLCMLLEAVMFRMLCASYDDHQFKLRWVVEET